MYGHIYKTTNLINGKIYVGQSKYNMSSYLGSGKLLWYAIKKHGRSNFLKEILEKCESKEILQTREIYWINTLKSRNREIGYNIAAGGSGGDTISTHPKKKEIFENISNNRKIFNALKGRKLSSEEKLSRKISFNINKANGLHKDKELHHRCYKHTNETKEKMSNARKKYWINLSTEDKLIKSITIKSKNKLKRQQKPKKIKEKYVFSLEHRQKISDNQKGVKPGNIQAVEINDVKYISILDAAIAININYSTLRNRIKSKNKKFNNYKLVHNDII